MTKFFTYRGTVKVGRIDGAEVKDIQVSNTVRANDECDAEAICHIETIESVKIAMPGYRILILPTFTNGKLTARLASDYGF